MSFCVMGWPSENFRFVPLDFVLQNKKRGLPRIWRRALDTAIWSRSCAIVECNGLCVAAVAGPTLWPQRPAAPSTCVTGGRSPAVSLPTLRTLLDSLWTTLGRRMGSWSFVCAYSERQCADGRVECPQPPLPNMIDL